MKALITGGAGFIGSHIADKLIEKNYSVTIMDNLSSTGGKVPDYLNKNAKFIYGDVRNKKLLRKIVPNFNIIFHKAASVGIAQSNYEIESFVNNNCLGTSKILESIIESGTKPKLIISTSNTTYGEGIYFCDNHGKFHPAIRSIEDVKKRGFELNCPKCKNVGRPIQTPEDTELNCNSIYALTKKFQEESSMLLGKTYNFPVILLKYFNVFGPRQSLSNPYTGVSAIFMSRVKNDSSPVVYEDGNQTRDFVYIDDVVRANISVIENENAKYEIFNVGSGKPVKIRDIAEKACELYKKDLEIKVTNKFRKGDIRHCTADIAKIEEKLGWRPEISFEEGFERLYKWSRNQDSRDGFERADNELKEKGLI